jgi:putative tricarboxylic transport membrane protein
MTDVPSSGIRGRRPDRAALLIALGLAVAALVIFWNAARLGGGASYARIGPTVFPYAIGSGLLALAVGTALKAWRGGLPEREPIDVPPVLWIVGGLAAQMLTIAIVGFSIATGILFALTARGFGRGPLWFTVPVGIALSFAIYFVFTRFLQLSLPVGPLERLL